MFTYEKLENKKTLMAMEISKNSEIYGRLKGNEYSCIVFTKPETDLGDN